MTYHLGYAAHSIDGMTSILKPFNWAPCIFRLGLCSDIYPFCPILICQCLGNGLINFPDIRHAFRNIIVIYHALAGGTDSDGFAVERIIPAIVNLRWICRFTNAHADHTVPMHLIGRRLLVYNKLIREWHLRMNSLVTSREDLFFDLHRNDIIRAIRFRFQFKVHTTALFGMCIPKNVPSLPICPCCFIRNIRVRHRRAFVCDVPIIKTLGQIDRYSGTER